MKSATILKIGIGTHKPLVTGSIPVAATNPLQSSVSEQGTHQSHQAYSAITSEQGISIPKAIESFLLSCKVEGKSYGTIECYPDSI
jgi:hypothetical protein